jgi:uncharacterized membrane protein
LQIFIYLRCIFLLRPVAVANPLLNRPNPSLNLICDSLAMDLAVANLHFSCSVCLFIWKLINGLLPLDNILRKLGLSLASKCFLCYSHEETILHIFFYCPVAQHLWKHCLGSLILDLEDIFQQIQFRWCSIHYGILLAIRTLL